MAGPSPESASNAQPSGMAVCSPQVTHAAYLHLARVWAPNWIYMIAQCRKIPLQKDLRPNFTHKCIYASGTYTSESHVFISQGRKSTPDDPASPSLFACTYKVICATNIVLNIIQGFCQFPIGARRSFPFPLPLPLCRARTCSLCKMNEHSRTLLLAAVPSTDAQANLDDSLGLRDFSLRSN